VWSGYNPAAYVGASRILRTTMVALARHLASRDPDTSFQKTPRSPRHDAC